MKSIILALILIFTGVCFGQKCDPRYSIAWSAITDSLGWWVADSSTGLYIDEARGDDGHKYYSKSALDEVERHKQQLAKLRKWAETQKQEDRSLYLGIIEVFEDGVKDAENEYKTHDGLNHMNAYEIHLQECEKEKNEYNKIHVLPKPPSVTGGK